jgi:GNAT superfamily N-acetyltransferase
MNIRLQYDMANVDWNLVVDILKRVGMGYHTSEIHRRAFTKSFTVVFAFDGDALVGFGRAISDGEYQAAIYDVAVLPSYQGRGIGRMIVNAVVTNTPGCSFILYASPGKSAFYAKEGFRPMKTGMALFADAERMQRLGFTE